VKSRIAQQKTKVETVKEILEKFLDDDEDMKDMNLSSKLDYYANNDSIELQPRVSDPHPEHTFSVCRNSLKLKHSEAFSSPSRMYQSPIRSKM